MSDIYEHKARKYEYKYLKLKKKYIGEGGLFNFLNSDKTIKGMPLYKLNNTAINEQNILQILKKLKDGIINTIIPLYNKGYILGNIDFTNISLDYYNNIYFNNQVKYYYKDKDKVQQFKKENNYPFLLHHFYDINQNKVTKQYLINFYNDYQSDYKPQHLIFQNLDDKEEYNLDEIYDKYILPIAKNIDILALSLFISYILELATKSSKDNKYNETYILAKTLYVDAYFNKINGASDLSERLQIIINSIPK